MQRLRKNEREVPVHGKLEELEFLRVKQVTFNLSAMWSDGDGVQPFFQLHIL